MFDPSEVHRLNTDRFATTYGSAAKLLKKRHYLGKLMVSGDDAAIEIVGEKIIATVSGTTEFDNPGLERLVESCRPRLLALYRKLAKSTDDRIVIAGVWHNAFAEFPPYLEPYLLHHVSGTGLVSTRRYDLNLFPWDSSGDGPIMQLRLDDSSGVDAQMQLRYVTEGEIHFDRPRLGSTGKHVMQGVVWYPNPSKRKHDLPIVVCRAAGWSKFAED